MHLPSSHDEAHAAPDGPEGQAAGCGADTRRLAPTRINTRHQESPQPNFARNLTRSFFVIGQKRCNSNDTNSTFEQATGELRATLLGNHSGIPNGRTHRLERARRSGGPGCGADTRHQESPQPNFARNLTRSFFEIGHKRCNSNNANSMFEQATGELRATLLGNHPDQRGGRTHRQAAPVTSRYTRYVALHPLRGTTPDQNGCTAYGSGALPTDRVHRTTLEHTTEDSAAPARITHGQELTKPQEPRAPPATTGHGLTGNTSQPTGRAHKPHPSHNEAATGFPATASLRSAALSEAPPIRRSCPRDPRPRRGQPRGGRRGRGTGSRTRSPGPHCGRSGSTAGRHRARHTRRA